MTGQAVIVKPLAQKDIAEAYHWYELESPGLGQRFHDAIGEAIRQIQERPRSFPKVYGEARRALTDRFPYAVYFVVGSDVTGVVAVLHGHRRASTLVRQRLKSQ